MNQSDILVEIDGLLDQGDVQNAVNKLREARESGVSIASQKVKFAHKLLLCAQWGIITGLLARGTNFFSSSGWLQSVLKSRPINDEEEPIPWFTYPAIDFLDGVIDPNWSVFEWGSGHSTLWWANRVKNITAIENNAGWYQEIRHQMPDNARLSLIENSQDYVDAIHTLDEPYDIIVIDGSHRNLCAEAAHNKLKKHGLLIFDNSDVQEYQAAQDRLKAEGLYRIDFWGLVPSYLYKNCTSIYFKDPSILVPTTLPHEHSSSVGQSCSQVLDQRK